MTTREKEIAVLEAKIDEIDRTLRSINESKGHHIEALLLAREMHVKDLSALESQRPLPDRRFFEDEHRELSEDEEAENKTWFWSR